MGEQFALAIVDDDEALLLALKESLELLGCSCETFLSAESALGRLEDGGSFDAIVADVVLPGRGGLELTREVKRRRPDACVIAMTGFLDDISYDRAVEAGASDFIKKPFTVQELLMRVRHVKMQERMRTLSFTDELTGLPNRRGFFAFAERQMKAANRSGRDIVLLFADLDHFKQINDTQGHQAGDEALAAAANIFRKTFRDSDIIARMGGDEFAVLLLDTPGENLAAIDERLRRNIDEYNSRRQGGFTLSVSVGVAVYDRERPQTIDELLRLADGRMYEEKERKYAPDDKRKRP